MKNIDISIVVPTIDNSYNYKKLKLEKQASHLNVELIIVYQADSSMQNTQSSLSETLEENKVYRHTITTKGTSIAKNFGIRHAKGAVIVFFDDDVEISKDYLLFLYESFKGNFVDLMISRIAFSREATLQSNNPSKIQREIYAGGPGSGIAIRRTAILETGIYFNEGLGGGQKVICGEDNVFCVSFFRQGYKLFRSNRYSCIHPPEGSTGGRRDEVYFRSYWHVMKNHYGFLGYFLASKFAAKLLIKERSIKSFLLFLKSYSKVSNYND